MATAATDTELVRRAQAGDRAAFQELYEAYLPKIYDFVGGMLRNRADAEDATSEAFLRAVERLDDLREPAAFKGWLYTIARNAALKIVDARKRATPVAEYFESATTVETSAAPLPAEEAERRELRELFQEAAATLSERDRTVFELTLRHGLSSAEVARVLDVRPAYAYILVNRLKGSVTEAVEAIALARTGAECPGLSEVLGRFGGEVSPRMRKAVARHARNCTVCADTKRRRAALPVLLEGVAFAEPSAAFTEQLSSQIDDRWSERSTGSAESSGGRSLSRSAASAVVVLVLAGALGGLAAQRTLVPEEEGPIAPAAERLDESATDAGVADVAPRRTTPQHEPTSDERRRAGGTSVTYDDGSSDGENSSDGSSVTNDEDPQTSTEPDTSGDDPTAGGPGGPAGP